MTRNDRVMTMAACFQWINILRPEQNDQNFANDFFKKIFNRNNVRIYNQMSQRLVSDVPICNKAAFI